MGGMPEPAPGGWPPLGCLPLFAAASPEYADGVQRLIQAANQVYADFARSAEGQTMHGPVALVGDAVGSILLYDALCRDPPAGDTASVFGSDGSIAAAGAGADDAEEASSLAGGRRPNAHLPRQSSTSA